MQAWHGLISSDEGTTLGKPVVVGTRITVEHILEKLACGETIAEVLENHPPLTEEGVQAALAFAAEATRSTAVHSVDGAKSIVKDDASGRKEYVPPRHRTALEQTYGMWKDDERIDEAFAEIDKDREEWQKQTEGR